jgi:hypothetical protein
MPRNLVAVELNVLSHQPSGSNGMIGMEIFNRSCKSCLFGLVVRERLHNLRTRLISLVEQNGVTSDGDSEFVG